MSLVKARISNVSTAEAETIEVLFNPTEYGIDSGSHFAELQVPGLKTPILQFVRGEAQMLNLELFLDGTGKRLPVDEDLERLRKFIRIDGELHAPPVMLFEWGQISFTGVVTSFTEKFQLFAEDGKILRARVTLTIKSYKSAEVQLREVRLSSPDRTRVRVLREGETLAQLAREAYGDPRLWRVIAQTNDVDRPRFVPPGTVLRLPSV